MRTRLVHGPAVRAIRKALGIPQQALALDVGVSAGYMANIEKGRKQPSDAVARKIADRLQLTLDEITYVVSAEAVIRSVEQDAA